MSLDTHETAEATRITTLTAPAWQILDGLALGVRARAECRACHQSLREGSPAALRAHRMSDEAAWSADSVLCMDCLGEWGSITPTPGVAEVVVLGRLVTRSDAALQTAQLAFRAGQSRSDVLSYSGVGDAARDPIEIE